MKKFLSIALALIMTMALAVPAFAAEGDVQVNIMQLLYEQRYDAYKIADLKSHSGDNFAYEVNKDYTELLVNIFEAETTGKLHTLFAAGANSAAELNSELVKRLDALDPDRAQIDLENGYFGHTDAKAFAEEFVAKVTGAPAASFTVSAITKEEYNPAAPKMANVGTVTPGYYIFVQSLGATDQPTVKSLYIMDTAYEDALNIYPKTADVPEVEKDIVIGDTTTDVDYIGAGDTVNYQVTATLPKTIDEFKVYTLNFHDVMEHQTYVADSSKVVITLQNGTELDLTNQFTLKDTGCEPGNGHTLCVGVVDIFTAVANEYTPSGPNRSHDGPLLLGATVTWTYSATLNDDAVMGMPGNKNTAHVEYSNDPYFDFDGERPTDPFDPEIPTDETPGSMTIVITYQTTVNKVDEAEKPLDGAQFTLEQYIVNEEPAEGADKYSWEVVDVKDVNPDGHTFNFNRVGPGIYKLTETKAPNGYNAIDPMYFEISVDKDAEADTNGVRPVKYTALKYLGDNADTGLGDFAPFGESETGNLEFELKAEHAGADTSIMNMPGTLLPSTGGMGTTILYIGGAAALIAAAGAILFISRKKKSAE